MINVVCAVKQALCIDSMPWRPMRSVAAKTHKFLTSATNEVAGHINTFTALLLRNNPWTPLYKRSNMLQSRSGHHTKGRNPWSFHKVNFCYLSCTHSLCLFSHPDWYICIIQMHTLNLIVFPECMGGFLWSHMLPH